MSDSTAAGRSDKPLRWVVLVFLTACLGFPAAAQEPITLILYNGKIWTGNPPRPRPAPPSRRRRRGLLQPASRSPTVMPIRSSKRSKERSPTLAPLTRTINAWEGRWPLNTYRDRDATKLSRSALERLAMAEAMTLTEYGAAITVRQRNRETHARLAARYDAAIVLAAPGAAPVGLGSTGNPVFNVPASMLGIPAVSLPLLSIEGLPLGLQIAGFVGEDASLFAVAAAHPRSAGRSGLGFRNFLRRHRCSLAG